MFDYCIPTGNITHRKSFIFLLAYPFKWFVLVCNVSIIMLLHSVIKITKVKLQKVNKVFYKNESVYSTNSMMLEIITSITNPQINGNFYK